MLQEAFDSAQLSSMTLAIAQIVEELDADNDAQRNEVARAVLGIAAETGVFDTAVLVQSAKARLKTAAV